jgi:hypothetical protein
VSKIERSGRLFDLKRQRERPFQPTEVWEGGEIHQGSVRRMAARPYRAVGPPAGATVYSFLALKSKFELVEK